MTRKKKLFSDEKPVFDDNDVNNHVHGYVQDTDM